jgi:colicin import membrane protein
MFNFFKRKNAQPVVDKEAGTSKFNAEDVSVDVDGKKVKVSELEKAMNEKEAEEAEAKKKAEEKEDEPLSVENSVTLSNGKEYKVGDLVENWKVRQNKKNGDESAEEKEKAAKKLLDDAEAEEKKNALKARANACGLKDNATEEEVAEKEKEVEKKNAADAEAKKKAEEKEEAEKKENAKKSGMASFKELHNAGAAAAGAKDINMNVGVKTRDERAADWKKRNSSKK